MDESRLLRTARRYAGLSQRGLAARAGVSASTVEALEAGRRGGSVPVVARLLEAAGLELAARPRTPTACRHLRRHLRRSLVQRLYLAVGGTHHPVHDRAHEPWTDLWDLAGRGRVEVVADAAVGVWAPVVADRPAVRFRPYPPQRTVVLPRSWRVLPPSPPTQTVRVPIGFLSRVLWVATPDVLALDPTNRRHLVALQASSRLLHDELPLDDAGRRPPAHRDPQPFRDDHEVRHTKAFRQLPPPEPADRRGWQLDGDASLAQWLRRRGYPT